MTSLVKTKTFLLYISSSGCFSLKVLDGRYNVNSRYQKYNNIYLEMRNIAVAVKIWVAHWDNKRIEIFCDNITVVQVVKTGRARDETAISARNLWLIPAVHNFEFIFTSIPGKANPMADLMPCWGITNQPFQNIK